MLLLICGNHSQHSSSSEFAAARRPVVLDPRCGEWILKLVSPIDSTLPHTFSTIPSGRRAGIHFRGMQVCRSRQTLGRESTLYVYFVSMIMGKTSMKVV